MHSENNELVRAGHELAKCLDNEPLIDIAKMIVRLADKLDVTTAALREKTKQCDALAAEVCDVKHPGTYLPSKCETPATEAFIAEQRAQGVEMFVEDFTAPSVMNNGKFFNEDLADAAKEFAAELRQGGDA